MEEKSLFKRWHDHANVPQFGDDAITAFVYLSEANKPVEPTNQPRYLGG